MQPPCRTVTPPTPTLTTLPPPRHPVRPQTRISSWAQKRDWLALYAAPSSLVTLTGFICCVGRMTKLKTELKEAQQKASAQQAAAEAAETAKA